MSNLTIARAAARKVARLESQIYQLRRQGFPPLTLAGRVADLARVEQVELRHASAALREAPEFDLGDCR